MAEFGECTTNIADLTEAQLCQGFGGSCADGIPTTSANLNAVFSMLTQRIVAIEGDVVEALASATYDAGSKSIVFLETDGDPVSVDLTPLFDEAVDAAVAEAFLTSGIPPRCPIPWYPLPGDPVPVGWFLCDGANGTPDLRDRFIVGAGGAYAVGDTGGAASHDHGGATGDYTITDVNIPPHHHYIAENVVSTTVLPSNPDTSLAWSNGNSPGEEEYELSSSGTTTATMGRTSDFGGNAGAADPHSHGIAGGSSLPPYYAMAWIMRP